MENKEKQINVCIGFATGRKNFKRVVNTYIQSWKECGLVDAEKIMLNLFVVYDLNYNKTKISDYTDISNRLVEMVDGLKFLDAAYVLDEAEKLINEQVISREESRLLFGSGYAAMRNIILYAALKQGMDYLLYLDDDEYPVAVSQTKNNIIWCGQHVLKLHLENIQQADITNGLHCGYISPVPQISFNEVLRKNDFRMFIEAISNDIISWKSMEKVMKNGGITYAKARTIESTVATEVQEINGSKFISGSNLCINLTEPGRTLPFYNPPGARGEDTFLSTCLSERRVLRMPCYTFHDGFSTYQHLLSGVLPLNLKRVTVNSQQVLNRFYRACIGWIRYKPLLLYITQRDGYEEQITRMRGNLQKTLPKLCAYFHTNNFMNIGHELEHYHKHVQEHHQQFLAIQWAWEKIVKHLARSN